MPLRTRHLNIRDHRSTRAGLEWPADRAHLWRRGPAAWIVALLLLTGAAARAQMESAEDFFNGGAQFYISNNIPAALERTETGLKLYPEDAKLRKLEELLKQQQQQQSQEQQQKNNPQNSQSQQQQQSQNRRQKQQQNQKPQEKQAQQKKQAKSAAQKPAEQKQQAPPAGQMTPQEARRLLDAQKENEQFLQPRPNVPPRSKQPIEDW